MKPNDNDGALNATSIKIKECPKFIKIFPKVLSNFPCDLEDILNIPSHVISYLELLDCLRMEEFREDFTMRKRKLRSEEEVTVEPGTKTQFNPIGKTELEICLHNIRQEKIEEPAWKSHFYVYLK